MGQNLENIAKQAVALLAAERGNQFGTPDEVLYISVDDLAKLARVLAPLVANEIELINERRRRRGVGQ